MSPFSQLFSHMLCRQLLPSSFLTQSYIGVRGVCLRAHISLSVDSIGATLSLLFPPLPDPSHQTCLGLSLIQLKWSPEDDIAFYHLNSDLALAVVGQIKLLTSFCCTENDLCGFLQVSPTKYYKEYVIFLPVT